MRKEILERKVHEKKPLYTAKISKKKGLQVPDKLPGQDDPQQKLL